MLRAVLAYRLRAHGIDHQYNGGVIVHIANNDRHSFYPGKLTGSFAPIPGNQFVATIGTGSCDSRGHYTVVVAREGISTMEEHELCLSELFDCATCQNLISACVGGDENVPLFMKLNSAFTNAAGVLVALPYVKKLHLYASSGLCYNVLVFKGGVI